MPPGVARAKQNHPQFAAVGESTSLSIGGGHEDAKDSNLLRHDPIYKIACGRLPIAQDEVLVSQPTMTRLEKHVSQQEVAAMRSRMVQGFINRIAVAPEEIVLDIDGWDDPTPGQSSVELFSRLLWAAYVLSGTDQ